MKEKVFYVVTKTETESLALALALPEFLSVFASPEQMDEGFFLFLAKGAAICLFDTYFVQKVICGYFSVKEFKLERSKL